MNCNFFSFCYIWKIFTIILLWHTFHCSSLINSRFPAGKISPNLLFSNSIVSSGNGIKIGDNSHIFTITDSNFVKQRLDVYLSSQFPEYSRTYLGEMCTTENVLVNGKVQDKNYKLKMNDSINIKLIEKVLSSVEPENIPLEVLYEDDDIIVVNKHVGMVVHPAPGSPNGTFVNALLHHLGESSNRLFENVRDDSPVSPNEDELDFDDIEIYSDLPDTNVLTREKVKSLRPGIVHRLDKGTSGVLIAGKHSDAVSKLSKMFASRLVRKVYLTITVGHPGDTTLFDPIGRDTKNRQLMTTYDGPPGKIAISHIRTLGFDGKLAVALVRIETGRTHQIRVHLKARRTPVAGDEDYGNKDWNKKLARMYGVNRPLLHAYETEITHPYTNKQLIFRAPLPTDISSIINKLVIPYHSSTLLDEDSKFLTGSTDVKGKLFQDDSVKFVPMDRLMYEKEVSILLMNYKY